jgi:hypothetical protein
VMIAPDELIRYIKDNAAEQASAGARERLNFFFTLVGIVIGLLAAIAAGVIFMLEQRLSSIADAAAKKAVVEEVAKLSESLGTEVAAMRSESQAELANRSNAMVLMPLLATDVVAWTQEGGYSPTERNRALSVMGLIRPELVAMKGPAREIAFQRVADMIALFYKFGDYQAVLVLYDSYGAELLRNPLTYEVMGGVYASLLISDPSFGSARAPLVQEFLAFAHDTSNRADRMARNFLLLVQEDLSLEADQSRLQTRLQQIEAIEPGFLDYFSGTLTALRRETSAGGVNPSAFGLANVDRYLAAIEQSSPEPQSVEDPGTVDP